MSITTIATCSARRLGPRQRPQWGQRATRFSAAIRPAERPARRPHPGHEQLTLFDTTPYRKGVRG